MKIMFFLILLSLTVAVGFLFAFMWATHAGQFDDDYTPSVRMLFDDKTSDVASALAEPVQTDLSVEK